MFDDKQLTDIANRAVLGESECAEGSNARLVLTEDVVALILEVRRLQPLAAKWEAHEKELEAEKKRASAERWGQWAQAAGNGDD